VAAAGAAVDYHGAQRRAAVVLVSAHIALQVRVAPHDFVGDLDDEGVVL
jgi:hypothetical protein